MERKERIVGIIDTGAGKPCRLSFLGSKKACIYISMRSGVKTYGCMYSNGCSDARKG
jgi:hypothetical protein